MSPSKAVRWQRRSRGLAPKYHPPFPLSTQMSQLPSQPASGGQRRWCPAKEGRKKTFRVDYFFFLHRKWPFF